MTVSALLQVAGSLCGIAGLAIVLLGGLSSTQRFVLGLVCLAAVALVGTVTAVGRRQLLEPMTQAEMIATGRRLIEHDARNAAVLFADDLTWAREHGPVIATAVREGKAITVIYPERKRAVARDHARTLVEAGARVVEVAHDPRLRAVLIDPDDPSNALLYVVNKVRGADAVRIGRRESGGGYFEGKIYRWKEDSLLIATAIKLYEALDE